MTVGRGAGDISGNTVFGYQVLSSNISGNNNAAIGYNALGSNKSGLENTAIGSQALSTNQDGDNNTAIGYQALKDSTVDNNTAIGQKSLFINTTGTNNTSIGITSLASNTDGSNNTAIGFSAINQTNASDNTAIGYNALYGSTGGSFNTAIGSGAFQGNNFGSYNTAIGYNTLLTTVDLSNSTCIGHGAAANNSNVIVLGNNQITGLYCNVQVILPSDERDKKEIEPLSYGLDYINEISPVHFLWNMRDGGKIDIPEIGFIAQNLKRAQTTLNINIPYLVDDSNPYRLRVSPSTLIPILVKSVQELSNQLNETNRKLEELTAKVNNIL